MILGKYRAKRTGLVAEIRHILFNGADCYTCKINGKVYRMDTIEFKQKWEHIAVEAKTKQEVISCLEIKRHVVHE